MTTPNLYDAVPYISAPRPQTHPDHLATLATLFGMRPAPVDACRVLELGCNDAANLIPMAYALPGSTFVGIDLAARPLAHGQRTIDRLGLPNIQLLQRDVTEGAADLGQFDYIIAHGLYSWVPIPVREALLATAKACLGPNGVAFVSYNAHPGGHLRNLIRELMLVHAGEVDDPGEKVRRGLEIVQFISTSKSEPDLYRLMLAKELERLTAADAEAIFHDDLAAVNEPIALDHFVDEARRHRLQYLADADPTDLLPRGFSADVLASIEGFAAGDRIRRERYLDLLTCRRFRQTLLCHDHIEIGYEPNPGGVDRMLVASWLRPVATVEATATEWRFEDGEGATVTAGHPLAAAALRVLGETWPAMLRFDTLLVRAREAAGPAMTDPAGEERLRAMLVQLYACKLAGLCLHRPAVLVVGERPVASALARLELEHGTRVSSLFHRTVALDDDAGARDLVRLLDGTRDRANLTLALGCTTKELEERLTSLAGFGLLVG